MAIGINRKPIQTTFIPFNTELYTKMRVAQAATPHGDLNQYEKIKAGEVADAKAAQADIDAARLITDRVNAYGNENNAALNTIKVNVYNELNRLVAAPGTLKSKASQFASLRRGVESSMLSGDLYKINENYAKAQSDLADAETRWGNGLIDEPAYLEQKQLAGTGHRAQKSVELSDLDKVLNESYSLYNPDMSEDQIRAELTNVASQEMGATLDRARRVWGRADASEADKLKLQRLEKGIESMIETNILKYKQSASERNGTTTTTNPFMVTSGITFNPRGTAVHKEGSPMFDYNGANGIEASQTVLPGIAGGLISSYLYDWMSTSKPEVLDKFAEEQKPNIDAYRKRKNIPSNISDKEVTKAMFKEYGSEQIINANEYDADAPQVASNLYYTSPKLTATEKNDTKVSPTGNIAVNPNKGVITVTLTNGTKTELTSDDVNNETKLLLNFGKEVNGVATDKLTHQDEYIVFAMPNGEIVKEKTNTLSPENKSLIANAKRDAKGNLLAYKITPDGIIPFGTDAQGNVGLMAGQDGKAYNMPLDQVNQSISHGIVLSNNNVITPNSQ
jgi:hypothetical protein